MVVVEIEGVLKVEDGNNVYYLGTLMPGQIRSLTFVPVVSKTTNGKDILNEKEEQGYQRAGDQGRMKKIQQFLEETPDAVIPPVLLSGRGNWRFEASRGRFGKLIAEDLAAIIDGQHRLGGLWMIAEATENEDLKRRPIPFMLVGDMDVEEEKRNFVNINDTQQGVKKSLLKYLGRHANFSGAAATALLEDDDSVFKGRIGLEHKKDSDLFLFGAAAESVLLTFNTTYIKNTGFRPDESPENQTRAISFLLEYWKLVRQSFGYFWDDIKKMPDPGEPKSAERPGTTKFEWRILEETGVRAFSKLGADLLWKAWIEGSKVPAFEQVKKYLDELAKQPKVKLALTKPRLNPEVLEMDHDLKSTGKAGVEAIYRVLRAELDRQ